MNAKFEILSCGTAGFGVLVGTGATGSSGSGGIGGTVGTVGSGGRGGSGGDGEGGGSGNSALPKTALPKTHDPSVTPIRKGSATRAMQR